MSNYHINTPLQLNYNYSLLLQSVYFGTGNGRFPDYHFPGQNVSLKDVSQTICINNLESFGMFM